MALQLPKPPISHCLKSLVKKDSVIHKIGEYIVEDMGNFRQKNYPKEVYIISPRKIENKVKTAIGDERVTKLNISRTLLALGYGMDEEDFWWSRTKTGGRIYRFKATPENLLFLKFRLRLI